MGIKLACPLLSKLLGCAHESVSLFGMKAFLPKITLSELNDLEQRLQATFVHTRARIIAPPIGLIISNLNRDFYC